MRTRFVLALFFAATIALSVWAAVVLINRDSFEAPTPVDESAPAGLDRYYSQSLSWESCGKADCADVEVPIDYDKPEGDTTFVRVSVHPAGGAQRSLFVNPGGPGGSALNFATYMASTFGPEVLAMYDIVGVDPRGIGESNPIDCLDDAEMDQFVVTDPDPDNSAEVQALRDSITQLGEGCLAKSGELAAHVSTEEAARDMDVVRALLGREKMDWFGASYGTQLGATYAELFPAKVGRMVLDGAVDPSLDSIGSALGQTTGFQRAFDAFAADCVKQSSCSLGSDLAAGTKRVTDLLAQLDEQPMATKGDREITEGNAFYGIAVTLYDESTWSYLDRALGEAFDGDGTTLLFLSDAYFERSPSGKYANNSGEAIYAVNCLDVGIDLTLKQAKEALAEFERVSPVFGRALGWGVLNCTDWPIEATHPQGAIKAAGAPPIVVVGTTRDPATPYEWAKALADQLDSGVLISREGDGHTAYTTGNQCIVKAVDTYFVDGTVPQDGLLCKAE